MSLHQYLPNNPPHASCTHTTTKFVSLLINYFYVHYQDIIMLGWVGYFWNRCNLPTYLWPLFENNLKGQKMPLISNSFCTQVSAIKRASSLTLLSPAIIQICQRYYPAHDRWGPEHLPTPLQSVGCWRQRSSQQVWKQRRLARVCKL